MAPDTCSSHNPSRPSRSLPTLMLPRGSKPSSSVTIWSIVRCTSLSDPVSSPPGGGVGWRGVVDRIDWLVDDEGGGRRKEEGRCCTSSSSPYARIAIKATAYGQYNKATRPSPPPSNTTANFGQYDNPLKMPLPPSYRCGCPRWRPPRRRR